VVLGQGRIGVRIASLIAYLRTSLRLPIRRIQAYLSSLHQLFLSSAEVVELLHQIRHALQPPIDALKTAAHASPILHGDQQVGAKTVRTATSGRSRRQVMMPYATMSMTTAALKRCSSASWMAGLRAIW